MHPRPYGVQSLAALIIKGPYSALLEPRWGQQICSIPVQTGGEPVPAYYTMCVHGLSDMNLLVPSFVSRGEEGEGGKAGGAWRGVHHPPPCSAQVKNDYSYAHTFTLLRYLSWVTFTLTFSASWSVVKG